MTQPPIMNRIRWFVDAAMDAPELRSPQPCPRGIACDYKRKNEAGILEKAWCKFVHPGEEGTGRSIWAEKRLADGTILPAVVRLSGQHTAAGGGWVQRLKERLCWPDWAAKHGLQADTTAGPLEIVRIGGSRGSMGLSPLNPARPQGSQSHRRPQRIDLGGGGTMTAYSSEPAEPLPVCASVLAAPAQFPQMAYVPQPPPRLNLLSNYERDVRLGFRGPAAVAAARARNAEVMAAAARDEVEDDGTRTPCLSNYNFSGPQPPPRLNLLTSEEREAMRGFRASIVEPVGVTPTEEYEDGCATPCLLRCSQEGDDSCGGRYLTPSLSNYEDGCATPRLPATGENCGEGEMDNVD